MYALLLLPLRVAEAIRSGGQISSLSCSVMAPLVSALSGARGNQASRSEGWPSRLYSKRHYDNPHSASPHVCTFMVDSPSELLSFDLS